MARNTKTATNPVVTAPSRRNRTRTRSNGDGEFLRQAEVLQAAADLFAEKGYAATTVRDIAEAAGMLSGSLYHHFDSKESMIDAILSAFIDQTLRSYDEVITEGLGPKETFERLVDVSLGSMTTSRSAILIYQNEARFLAQEERFAYLRDAHRKFERTWTRVLEQGVKDGEFRATIDPKLIYRLVRDAIWSAPRWWQPGGTLTPERITEQYVAVLVDGVARHD
jgi:AcrR family transcriptional regulator